MTLAAEASEIAFSLERPPRMTAIRRLTGAASWSVVVVVVPSPPGVPAAAGRRGSITTSPGLRVGARRRILD